MTACGGGRMNLALLLTLVSCCLASEAKKYNFKTRNQGEDFTFDCCTNGTWTNLRLRQTTISNTNKDIVNVHHGRDNRKETIGHEHQGRLNVSTKLKTTSITIVSLTVEDTALYYCHFSHVDDLGNLHLDDREVYALMVKAPPPLPSVPPPPPPPPPDSSFLILLTSVMACALSIVVLVIYIVCKARRVHEGRLPLPPQSGDTVYEDMRRSLRRGGD
ncbi:uncharacterized protein LOC114794377 [Denticeps clupeoides]|uniref:uncharacterized protein LOC114794377 n=1 Tax=Denticeps clupeoides TaxID=299321 RepID=UPI0010A47984|nr:uncharacterized protein LOC114794377 [Denticeps clupeoides]